MGRVIILERGIIRQALMATKQRQQWNWGQRGHPVLSLLAGATMWGVVWYPMRLLESHGLSGPWLTMLLYLAATIGGLILAARQLQSLLRQPLLMVGIALSAGWTNLAFVLAILDGNVMRVLFLFYLSPAWAILLGWLVMKEHIDRWTVAILIVALTGGWLMLLRPGSAIPLPTNAADWLALTSGIAFAVSNVFVNKAQDTSVSIKSLTAWIGVTVLSVVLIILRDEPVPHFSFSLILGVIALGWLGTVVMTLFVQYGVTHMPVHRSGVILLFELVAGALSQQLLTDESLVAREWFGGALVVAASLLIAGRQYRHVNA
jgi:drug/metabolite transporter (DMT)-like permease